jgi:hypothetical protein
MTDLATTTLLHPGATATKAAEAAARAKADALLQDDTLAQSKGNTPEHIAARQRVARQFCDIHLPNEDTATRDARLASIDYTCPVVVMNAKGIDPNAPKKRGLFDFKRKPTHVLSTCFPPQKPDDPVYALEYFVIKS